MAHKENHPQLSELGIRLNRIENELLYTEKEYQQALAAKKPTETLNELKSDIENLNRKISWFSGAIKRYMQRQSS